MEKDVFCNGLGVVQRLFAGVNWTMPTSQTLTPRWDTRTQDSHSADKRPKHNSMLILVSKWLLHELYNILTIFPAEISLMWTNLKDAIEIHISANQIKIFHG